VYISGGAPIYNFWIENGHFHDIGVELNAVMIGYEMRFFGDNHPTSDLTLPNLRFLSDEQALADIAHLIDHVKAQDARLANARAVVAGRGFGASLATYFRSKYPHHSDGLWSSSSYVEKRFNFPGEPCISATNKKQSAYHSNACF